MRRYNFFEIKGRSSATQLSKIKSLEFYVQMAPPGAKHDGPRTEVGMRRYIAMNLYLFQKNCYEFI